MKEYVELLKKHKLSFAREVFYVLLNCIDDSLSKYEDLVSSYKNQENFDEIKDDYKKFYDYIHHYFDSLDLANEMFLHHKVIELIDVILESDTTELQKELKMFISNVIDLIFLKYHLNITNFNSNEEIKAYLLEKIKDEKIVNLLVLLLLADTTLNNKNIEDIPEDEFEHIISTIILIAIYICKGTK